MCTVKCVFMLSFLPVLGVCMMECVCGECCASVCGFFTVSVCVVSSLCLFEVCALWIVCI